MKGKGGERKGVEGRRGEGRGGRGGGREGEGLVRTCDIVTLVAHCCCLAVDCEA